MLAPNRIARLVAMLVLLAVAPGSAMGDARDPNMTVDTDAEADARCLVAIASGDRAALAELYDRHSPQLLALGVRILGNRREAEDLVHDVFVEAWKRASEYDPERGRVKTWLMLRMRCRCIDRVKSASYSRSRPLPPDGESSTMQSSLEDADLAPDAQRVRAALDALPEDQRTVLLLGYFEGLSSSEIAERLGIPMGTVKSRVASAMQKLRASLRVPPPEEV